MGERQKIAHPHSLTFQVHPGEADLILLPVLTRPSLIDADPIQYMRRPSLPSLAANTASQTGQLAAPRPRVPYRASISPSAAWRWEDRHCFLSASLWNLASPA
jgi:hypothetical protein